MYWQLFWSFFKIGAFTFGGGYAMIPLIQKEVVGRKKWLAEGEFVDYKSWLIFAGVFAASMKKVDPILLIVVSGVLGYIIYQ